jgi:hypothetical protein
VILVGQLGLVGLKVHQHHELLWVLQVLAILDFQGVQFDLQVLGYQQLPSFQPNP